MKTFFRSAINPLLAVTLIALVICVPSLAQQLSANQPPSQAPRPLITRPVDEAQLTVLKGNTHPLARPEFDLGTAPAMLPMQRMLLVLKRSPEQESALEKLIDDQQDKSSPSYHKWLAPDEYGKQFGPTDTDIQTITAWLQSHGFQVGSTKGRTVLEFSGSAGEVQDAFHTTIHKYLVNGQQHWANASDPQIPAALTSAVAGVASLNNFPRHSMIVSSGKFKRDNSTGRITATDPQFTFPLGCVEDNSSSDPCFYGIGPYDFATIYNVLPLWNSGINGAGQTIAIVGETNINVQDVRDFRTLFGLPANDPQVILNGPDPGIQPDETEADLDVQWSGAVAPNATVDLVVSQSTETTVGTDLSAVYIIENNLAPAMSESYGTCELGLGTTGNQFYNALWQQAAAQGITVFISAGDNGSAGCDDFNAQSPAPAQFGLQISGYASTPYNVAVGGTDFNDFSNPGTYWNTTNNSTTQASAKGYIPETTWNDSCTNAIFGTVGFSSNAETNCNDSRITPAFDVPLGGSGGASNCTTPSGSTPSSCAGGYTKPSWQTGTGVPNDGKRDIPDVSLFASNGFLQNFYIVCESDIAGSCGLNSPYTNFLAVGGTSASSPAFAGIMALVNQQTGSRQGNANYIFYKLAAKQSASSCNSSNGPASTCVFNDVTAGTIAMPCATGSPNCTTSISGDQYGILTGYNAGAGYDQATGLGSVNANNLVTQWSSVTTSPSTTTLNSLMPTTLTHGQAVNFSVTVKPQSGSGTPTGTISLAASSGKQTIAAFPLSNGTASGSTEMLPGGTYQVTAHYPGDANYAASDSSPLSVTVSRENSQQDIFLVTFDPSGSGQVLNGHTNTAEYGTAYLLRVNVENAAGQVCSPFVAAQATPCPSGTVNLSNNGSPLNPGTYSLNEFGYAEDRTVQLPGGTDSVMATYSGDSGFNTSAVTAPITITQAPTQVVVPGVAGAVTGQSATIGTNVYPYTTLGAPPSGTVTFYANGAPLSGTIAYSSGKNPFPTLAATLTYTFTASGTYAITASYSGDANYGPANSSAQNITVLYPAPNVAVTPISQTVNYGGTASMTALIDTTNKSTYPTGTVTFRDGGQFGPILAAPTCTNAKDTSGNFACQAVGTFTITSGDPIFVSYSGDSNYPGSYSWAYINMPDFMIFTQGVLSGTAGQPQSITVTFQSSNGFGGAVSNFGCSALPAETTCAFSPTQVTLPSNGSVSTTLTITTMPLGQSRRHVGFIDSRMSGLGISTAAILFGACLLGIPLAGRRRIPILLIVAASFLVLSSCGGGGGGGGGGGPSNPVPSISSLSPAKIAAGSQVQSLYINGSNFMTSSTVTYNGTLHNSSLQSNTQIQIALGPTDVATTGLYPVVVINPAPGGGSSAPMNFDIVTGTPTGSFYITLTATSGPITHTATTIMYVQ
jgi:hypothetical protein